MPSQGRPIKLENWEEEYERKLVSVEGAAGVIKSGDNIFLPSAYYGQVLRAIPARREELENITAEYQAPLFDPGWFSPEMEDTFKIITRIFLGGVARPFHDEGRIHFIPYTNGTWFKVYRDDRPRRNLDVALIEVCPPDENGFMNFGSQIWERRHYADHADIVIAEIDNHLIRSHGDSQLHVSQVDYLVEISGDPATEDEISKIVDRLPREYHDRVRKAMSFTNPTRIHNIVPLLEDAEPERLALVFGQNDPDDVAKAIAENLKPLFRDRDTIQIGIGKPATYMVELGVFDHLEDLSIFTEMGAPGMGFLVKRGIATGRYSSLHSGKAVMAATGGMRGEEVQWVDNNPLFELYSSDYIVNIGNIVQNRNMVSINNGVQVDLTGQITCESQFGSRLINGPGGQIEFHIGAFNAPGGRAITLLPSTWGDGSVSNIVYQMEQGTLVSVPRVFADYVVTEWGVAQLAGKTHRERAEELVRVAHPDFREELTEAAKEIY